MGPLNKEKLVFLLSLLPLALCIYAGLGALRQVQQFEPQSKFREPAPAVGVLEGTVEIDWPHVAERTQPLRDPFAQLSDWRSAAPDALPLPEVPPLARRTPLPGILAGAHAARPPREHRMPERKEEE